MVRWPRWREESYPAFGVQGRFGRVAGGAMLLKTLKKLMQRSKMKKKGRRSKEIVS
jgi:hypothetical protein